MDCGCRAPMVVNAQGLVDAKNYLDEVIEELIASYKEMERAMDNSHKDEFAEKQYEKIADRHRKFESGVKRKIAEKLWPNKDPEETQSRLM